MVKRHVELRQLFLLLCLSPMAIADNDGVQKYRDFTPAQIAALTDEERSAEVPMMYIFATQSGLAQDSELLFGMQLNTLMYPGVHSYGEAVRQFQRDLGDPPTGVLTVWQIHSLGKRAELQNQSEVRYHGDFFSYIDESLAAVEGTFVILDEKIAYPVNRVSISCERKTAVCQADQTIVQLPGDDWGGNTYYVSKFDREYYTVTNWTEDSIDAVHRSWNKGCRTTTLNFNFATKEFYEFSRNTDRECKVLDTVIPKLDKPRISQIVDGKEAIAEVFAQRKKLAFDALSSDFRNKVSALEGEIASQEQSATDIRTED